MLTWYRQLLVQAGLSRLWRVTMMLATLAALTIATISELTGLVVVGCAIAVGELALILELIGKRASRRSKDIAEAWPTVLESLESAAIAGLSLTEAFRELADSHHSVVSGEFQLLCAELESGFSVENALANLGRRLALPCSDLTVEILCQVQRCGGQGLVASLRNQAASAREHELLVGELQAKQGWVLGTAKLAVAAPWVVIGLISMRAENASLYASETGVGITLFGLLASIVAFRLVVAFGRLDFNLRVLL